MLILVAGILTGIILIMWYKFTLLNVIIHEFAHAVVALLFGKKIKKIEVNGNGSGVVTHCGHGSTIKNNLITMAPYIFPLPFITCCILYIIAAQFEGLLYTSYILIYLVGLAYVFNLYFLYNDSKCQFSSKDEDRDFIKVGIFKSVVAISVVQLFHLITLILIGVNHA